MNRIISDKPTIRLGDIIEDIYRYPTFYGITYCTEGVGVIKGENISRNGQWVYMDKLNYISKETNEKYPRTELKENDLIMTVRGEAGKVAIVGKEEAGCNINANVIKIKLKTDYCEIKVLPRYIWYYLNSNTGKKSIRKQVSGGVQETITVSGISDIEIVLPVYSLQVKLVTALDNKLSLLNGKLLQADELLTGMSSYILSTLNIAPIRFDSQLCWKVKMSDLISDKTFSAEYYHPERMAAISNMRDACGSNVRKLNDIVDFCRDIVSCNDSASKYLGLAGVESQTGELSGADEEAAGQAFMYEIDDVLYGRLRPYLNKVVRAEEPGICSTEFHVMRVKDKTVILPEYLAAIMRSDLILSQTKHMMTGNTHPRISNDDVQNLYVPVPDIAVQEKIVYELIEHREKARRLKREAEQEWAAAKAHFEKELLGE